MSYTSYMSYRAVLLARRRRAGSAGRTSPCRGVGQRPTPSNQLISQNPLCVLSRGRFVASRLHGVLCDFTYSGSLRVPSWFFVNLRVSPAGQTLHTLPAVPSVAPDHYRVWEEGFRDFGVRIDPCARGEKTKKRRGAPGGAPSLVPLSHGPAYAARRRGRVRPSWRWLGRCGISCGQRCCA